MGGVGWGNTPVISVHKRLRGSYFTFEFEVSLGHLVSLGQPWLRSETMVEIKNPNLTKTKQKKKEKRRGRGGREMMSWMGSCNRIKKVDKN